MRNPASALFTRYAVLAFSAAIVFSAPVWSQRPTIRRVSMIAVKGDRVGDFEAAIKQYNEIYAKVPDVRSRGLFQSLTGPRQYMLVRDYEKWSELDPGDTTRAILANPELARLNLRIGSCIESETMFVEEMLPELSMASSPSEPPKLLRVARSRIRPDKVKEFEDLVKNELFPAYRKAETKSFTVRKVRFGGPTNDYYISTRLDGWAEIGTNPLSKSMGEEAYQKMVAKLSAVTTMRDINIYRFRSELSYHKEKAPAVVPTK
jgi:hypothetical protein